MPDKQIVFYAARHGQTTLNADNCFRGQANPSLDEIGFRDAHKLGYYFDPIELGQIFTSDKLRAVQTANAIAEHKDCDPIPIKELRALDVGDFSGQPKIKENTDAVEWYVEHPEVSIPGGESLHHFQGRVQPIFIEAIQYYEETGLPCLLVVHSSIIHEMGTFFNKDHHSSRVEPGGVAAVYLDNGELRAEPIFKKLRISQSKADTVS